MDRDYIDQNNLVERYILGRLPEQEAIKFEDRMVFDPELVRDVQATERLIDGLAETSAESSHASADGCSTETADRVNRVPRYPLVAAIAANIVLGLSTIYLVSERNVVKIPTTASQINPKSIVLSASRSSEKTQLTFVSDSKWVVLELSDMDPELEPYDLVLRNTTANEDIVTATEVTLDPFAPGIKWLVPGSSLSAATYSVVVTARESRSTYQFTFEVCDKLGSTGHCLVD